MGSSPFRFWEVQKTMATIRTCIAEAIGVSDGKIEELTARLTDATAAVSAEMFGEEIPGQRELIVEATIRNLAQMIANNRWLDTPDKVDTKASETNARAIFENIRAARPQALLRRCSSEYRSLWYTENVAQQLAKYQLPLRTEALGDEMQSLPPIDDKTHQYRYTTKTTEGRPVTYTITLVLTSPDGFSPTDWLLDQLTITEGTADKPAQTSPASP